MPGKPIVGLIVNPIAGMGGKVGLKGTDGEALRLALARGATPLAGTRVATCLSELAESKDSFTLCAGPGPMGEDVARSLGFEPVVLPCGIDPERTTSSDTVALALAVKEKNPGLILFAGGDGTARDVCGAIGEDALVLGIPAGVKIHSAVFASSPTAAGLLASRLIEKNFQRVPERTAEVMDIDEEAYRRGELKARLYGYMRVPYERGRVQGLKAGSPASEVAMQSAIGQDAADAVLAAPDTLFLIGAGTTTRALEEALGVSGTLLGVDAWFGGRLIATDIAEREILELLESYPKAVIVVTPIGGQGFIFGRGNQQFSPEVILRVGRRNIMLLATTSKIVALQGSPMLVDTGDVDTDLLLEGYYRIVTGYGQFTMHKVSRG